MCMPKKSTANPAVQRMLGVTNRVRTVAEDASEQKIIDDIAEFGWHCAHIMADGEHVQYSFTVGFSPDVAHKILSIAAHEAHRAVNPSLKRAP